MKASVVVTTYNEPDRLALALEGLARQTVAPAEILVADDGSGPETAAVVEAYRGRLAGRCEHVWHPDEGFRKGAICNAAVRRSTGDQLLFLDGDSIPARHWVEDHLRAAHRADVRCGRRVKLGPRISARVDAAMVQSGALERLLGPTLASALEGDTRRWTLGIRLPVWLATALHPRPRKLMGVNFALTRAAYEKVNGYDSAWPARREDRDLELRLLRAGCTFAALLQRAVVHHLHHEERPTPEATERRVREEEAASRVRCADGLVPAAAQRSRA